jgi:hypothetical protein
MAVSYQVGAGPNAVAIADQRTLPGGPAVVIHNLHASEPVYIGGDENQDVDEKAADLTASTGFRLVAGASLSVDIGAGDTLYARAGGTTVTVTVMVLRTSPRGT